MDEAAHLRIGELSYRVGVSPDVLRAWDKRYGLLRPTRSEGGYLLYSERDEWRARLTQQKLWSGAVNRESAPRCRADGGQQRHARRLRRDASGAR